MKAVAIIVAGGKGLRMKAETRKQYLGLSGQPVILHTLQAFAACESIKNIVLAVPQSDMDFCQSLTADFVKPLKIVAGGKERQNSVYNGLLAAQGLSKIVAIHDGVRPFVSTNLISQTIAKAGETGACILAIPAFDTLKQTDTQNIIQKTLARDTIWLAQTPQTFDYDLILKAHESARSDGFCGTDDASLVERLGQPVSVIPGSRLNMKITTPEDLMLAQAILEKFSKTDNPR